MTGAELRDMRNRREMKKVAEAAAAIAAQVCSYGGRDWEESLKKMLIKFWWRKMCLQVDDDKEVKKENYGEGEPLSDVEKV